MDIPQAINRCRPNTEWTLNGEEYSGLVWLDSTSEKPTENELISAWGQVLAEKPSVSVSMRSLRLALISQNLYQATVAAINGIPDAAEKLKAQIWWTSSPIVLRDNPYVISIGSAVGKSPQDIDEIFTAAKTLDFQQP
jgi:hypothetical protein